MAAVIVDNPAGDRRKRHEDSCLDQKEVSSVQSVTSITRIDHRETNERRVLVLYTGGTIGMKRGPENTLVPVPDLMVSFLRRTPHMHDEEYATSRFGNDPTSPLVLPDTMHRHRVLYTVSEYSPLLDSSNMSMQQWIQLAEDIKSTYDYYEGFVILHGTDTLAYTASALSFMLENLAKSVIVTGAQMSMYESRSDGREHLVNALILAGNYTIPEVTVLFGGKLMRGNRTTKVSSTKFAAFDSLDLAPLVDIGINIDVDYSTVLPTPLSERFSVQTQLNPNVAILTIFPSITTETVRAFLQPPIQGVVLQTYGSGNVPSNRKDLLAAFRDAIRRGVVIINCTQCHHGGVAPLYETGAVLMEIGVTSGWDMTMEAALAKLSYVLSKNWDIATKREMMSTNLRGELTTEESRCREAREDAVTLVAKSSQMSASSPGQVAELMCPALPCDAVVQEDDLANLARWKQSERLLFEPRLERTGAWASYK